MSDGAWLAWGLVAFGLAMLFVVPFFIAAFLQNRKDRTL